MLATSLAVSAIPLLSVEAADKNKSAKKAYEKVLSNGEGIYSAVDRFALLDVNNDGVSELITEFNGLNETVSAYIDGNVSAIVYGGDASLFYYPEVGVIRQLTQSQDEYYHLFDGEKSEQVACAFGIGTPDTESYSVNDKTKTKTEYEEYVKSLVGDSDSGGFSWRKNTASNRNKYLLGKKSSKKAVYETTLSGKSAYSNLYTSSIKIGANKMTIKGTLQKKGSGGTYSLLDNKTRSFKLAKNCVYISSGGESPDEKITKEQFTRTAESLNGLYLIIYTNKSGQIYKMIISS
jgi:hypothetical protein